MPSPANTGHITYHNALEGTCSETKVVAAYLPLVSGWQLPARWYNDGRPPEMVEYFWLL
jgi:hypothetical protein